MSPIEPAYTIDSAANISVRIGRQSITAKRLRIIETAMRHFAEHGYENARTEDVAHEVGISKGSIFQHFGNKPGLFLATYKHAAGFFARYLDAPIEVRKKGFWEILRYWLYRTEMQVRENWQPYRVILLGNYGSDLKLKREINRFLSTEDPYGTTAFVRNGLQEGVLRQDIDPEMIVSLLDWTVERFQDALLTEELDPGLFRRHGISQERTSHRIEQFLLVLTSAIAAPKRTALKPSIKR
jgi:AcrR family transcriptional regulator